MSYRLKPRESPAQGLQRIFREEIEAALKACRHPAHERGETVHETRKHLKKLRAALDLVAREAGKARCAREDKCARRIGRLVSDLRDAHVRLHTLVELREDDTERFAHLENLLAMERASFSAAFAGWQGQAIPRLEALRNRLARWPLDDLTWKNVCAAVAKSYRRGRNALDRALKKQSTESMHAWRKEVKQLWSQLRLLQPLNRVVLEKIAADAQALGQMLGMDHDYAFLLARFDQKQPERELERERTNLEKLIRKRGRRLQRNATELGRRFYAEPPKAFAKRISIFVDDWVSKKKRRESAVAL
jgi:CHAD domain-containing protein